MKAMALAATMAVLLSSSSASAMFVLDSADEMKCALGMSKGLAKMAGLELKCLTKCWRNHRKGVVDASDCVPPYAGATEACLHDAVKGATAKTAAKILKAARPTARNATWAATAPATSSTSSCSSSTPSSTSTTSPSSATTAAAVTG